MKLNAANVIDIVLAVIFLLSIIRGWRTGFALKAGHLAAVVGASVIAGTAAGLLKNVVSSKWLLPYLERQAGKYLHFGGKMEQGVSIASENVAFYLLFSLFFAIALILLHRLVRGLKIVDYIPVVGTLNKAAGALVGFLADFIILFILGRILFGVVPMDAWAQIGLTREMIESSYLLCAFVP